MYSALFLFSKVQGKDDFDAEAAAKSLREAMKGFGR